MLFFDVLMLSVAVGLRGGIRSDFYLGYYLILSYVALVRKKHLMTSLSLWVVVCYSASCYIFSDPTLFSIGRLFIRMLLMLSTAFLLQVFVYELIREEDRKNKAINMAFRDSMTNAYNRRMLTNLTPELEKNLPMVSTVLIDIDDFKQINDTYGHDAGDDVIKALVKTINDNIRENDYCFRYGGEEFLIVFTCGVSLPKKHSSLREMIHASDQALYKGKSNGKNQIVVA